MIVPTADELAIEARRLADAVADAGADVELAIASHHHERCRATRDRLVHVLDWWIADMDALLVAVGRLHAGEDAVAGYDPTEMLARDQHRARLERMRQYPVEHRRALLAEELPT